MENLINHLKRVIFAQMEKSMKLSIETVIMMSNAKWVNIDKPQLKLKSQQIKKYSLIFHIRYHFIHIL